ncbi:MAG: sulfotransferase domain-containing protein [Anaerolineales bacterium]
MKRLGSRLERWASGRFPDAYYRLVQRPRLRLRFAAEKELANGVRLSHSERRSILFFTTQKCASRYVSGVINALAGPAGMMHADYDAYVSMVRVPPGQNPFGGALHTSFVPRGYYYGPIGTFRSIPGMDEYSVILQLRDPRDMLTSLYFSTAYSHAVISPKMIRRRKESLAMTIDEFVTYEVGEYLPIYEEYCRQLAKNPHILFLKYEDMVSDFETWLDRLGRHIGLNDQVSALAGIRKEASFSVQSEDIYAQRRQVTPGDHKRKLQPDTINHLNQAFETVLRQLQY